METNNKGYKKGISKKSRKERIERETYSYDDGWGPVTDPTHMEFLRNVVGVDPNDVERLIDSTKLKYYSSK